MIFEFTASMLRQYKNCQRRFWFEYEELIKPEKPAEALEIGGSYHSIVEKILKREEYQPEMSLPYVMAKAFERYLPWQSWDIVSVEKEFRVRIRRGIYFKGKLDAICSDGVPIEHKTTRDALEDAYLNKLTIDDQVTGYLTALSIMRDEPVNRVIYTACQKPTIRLKQNETEEEFIERCSNWYDDTRVRTFTVVRSTKELEDNLELLKEAGKEMKKRKTFFRNPQACSIIKCPYASICLDYDPELLIGFVKKEKASEELCKF